MNLIFAHFVEAACICASGIIVLLILGTQILHWLWIPGLFVTAITVCLFRALRRVPNEYQVAQELDRRAKFSDSISTAFFFGHHAEGLRVSEAIRQAQRERAESLARRVNPAQAVPFSTPRSIYVFAMLAVVASALFAIRYGITERLDLRAPLANILFPILFSSSPEQIASDIRDSQQQTGLKEESRETPAGEKAKERTEAEEENAQNQQASLEQKGQQEKGRENEASATQSEDRQGEEENQGGEQRAEESTRASDSHQKRDGSQAANSEGEQKNQSGAQQASNSSHRGKSLLNQVRDAMANLMSRLKPQQQRAGKPGNASAKQNSSESQQQQQQEQASNDMGARSQNRASAKNRSARGERTSADGSDGEPSEKAENGAGKQKNNRSAEQASNSEASGIGNQEGDKQMREAEQLAAMGQITELFGRRAEGLSGEITVEVESNKQQIQTPYSRQRTTHAEAGGEIHRDEIPIEVQHYVQKYFDEVRKTPPTNSKDRR